MRRLLGHVLIGLGVFGIVLAVLFPTVVVHGSKKTPLDLNITLVSSGPATILDPTTQQPKQVTLRATRVVKSDSKASDSKNTTVDEALCIVIVEPGVPNCPPLKSKPDNPAILSASTDRVTTDRRSAEAVHVEKYGEYVGNGDATQNDTSVRHEGMAYKWPIDAKKKTYQFFLPDVKKAFPATYQGEDKINGLKVYKYVCESGPVSPYKVAGLFDGGTLTDTRTVFVEPRTGAIIKGIEHQTQALPDGTVALDTTLTFDQSAIDYQSSFAKKKINDLKLAQLYAPLVAALIGIAGLIGGWLLLRSSRPATNGGGHSGARRNGPPPGDSQPYSGDPFPFAGSSQP